MSEKKDQLVKHKCEYCGKNPADNKGKCKRTGLTSYRKYKKKYECKDCQRIRLGPKRYRTQGYMINKKDYCENKDGRLVFICDTDIPLWHDRHGNYFFLQVDHANENHEDDNLINHQTFCTLCHQYKTRIAIETQYICEDGKKAKNIMLDMFKYMYPDNEELVEEQFNKLKENVIRTKKRINKTKYNKTGQATLMNFI